MKYFNIKRYKFSTVTRTLGNLLDRILLSFKLLSVKKIYNFFDNIKYNVIKSLKFFKPRKFNLIDFVQNIKVKKNRFLFFHFPIFIVIFGFLYLAIPVFFTYEKSSIQKAICESKDVECIIKGKITYNFFPSPRLKVKNFVVNIVSKNKINILTANDVSIKLSIKNLLARELHKIKKIEVNNFETKIFLKKIKDYDVIFKNAISSLPISFNKGKILLYDKKNYIATISEVNLKIKKTNESSEAKLEGIFLNDKIVVNLSKEISNGQPETNLELRMQDINFFTKIIFSNSPKNIKNGKFLVKKDKNNISGIFDYNNNIITVLKSNIRNSFIDGKLSGKITFLPFFDFDLYLDLNSVNFTRLYNYFLSLDKKEQKKLFKVNNKINGKLNLSADKVYSKHNLIKSFESRIKFYNGNTKVEQFLINLGKLGAADFIGNIDNNLDSTSFKFESNIFVDNKKKFLSKFGIYNQEKLSSNLFVHGNFDLSDPRLSLYEISTEKKFNAEDINFIEAEFNDLMFEKGFKNLFNFQKFKIFIKSVQEEKN